MGKHILPAGKHSRQPFAISAVTKNSISFHHNYEVNKLLLLRKPIQINSLGMCEENARCMYFKSSVKIDLAEATKYAHN